MDSSETRRNEADAIHESGDKPMAIATDTSTIKSVSPPSAIKTTKEQRDCSTAEKQGNNARPYHEITRDGVSPLSANGI